MIALDQVHCGSLPFAPKHPPNPDEHLSRICDFQRKKAKLSGLLTFQSHKTAVTPRISPFVSLPQAQIFARHSHQV